MHPDGCHPAGYYLFSGIACAAGTSVSENRGYNMASGAVAANAQYNYEIVKKFAVMALIWGVLNRTSSSSI